MHRNPHKPYRQKWHPQKFKAKLEGTDEESLMKFMHLCIGEVLDHTTRMRRKRRHHIPKYFTNPWGKMKTGDDFPSAMGSPFSGRIF